MVNNKIYTFITKTKSATSGFYFIFEGKISSTQWISSVKDGFHCGALLRLRGSLDFARDDGTRSGIFTRKDDLSRRFFGFFKPSE